MSTDVIELRHLSKEHLNGTSNEATAKTKLAELFEVAHYHFYSALSFCHYQALVFSQKTLSQTYAE